MKRIDSITVELNDVESVVWSIVDNLMGEGMSLTKAVKVATEHDDSGLISQEFIDWMLH